MPPWPRSPAGVTRRLRSTPWPRSSSSPSSRSSTGSPPRTRLLEAVIARSANDLSAALESALQRAGEGWDRVEAVVRSVFRLAARQPELLGLLREVGRLGPPAATQMTLALEPLVQRASSFLEAEMAAGAMRRSRPAAPVARHLLHGDRDGHRGRGAARARARSRRPARWCAAVPTCCSCCVRRCWSTPAAEPCDPPLLLVGLGIFFRAGAFGV